MTKLEAKLEAMVEANNSKLEAKVDLLKELY